MKKRYLLSALLFVCLSLCLLISCGKEEKSERLYLYNWGEYIDEDLIDLFEEYYEETYGTPIEVIYNTYASNEVLYSKLTGGSSEIDLIIPSDYMADRLRNEGYLSELDFENIPHISGVSIPGMEENPIYDPDGKYTVPYTYGTVGLIYNKDKVDPADFAGEVSWRILWDADYKGDILMFNNSRDAFAVAQYILSYESGETKDYVNSVSESDWREALMLLQEQKPLLQAYVMDEVFNTMEGGSAALAPYYAGDYLVMHDANPSLGFVYPKEGTNLFVDAMCVPKSAQNKLAAERFIDFIISTEVTVGGEVYNPALDNANYICYATPVTAVRECSETYIDNEGEECYVYECYKDTEYGEILYGAIPTSYTFRYLDPETQIMTSDLWDELKIDTTLPIWLWVSSLCVLGVIVGLLVYNWVLKRRRAKYY